MFIHQLVRTDIHFDESPNVSAGAAGGSSELGLLKSRWLIILPEATGASCAAHTRAHTYENICVCRAPLSIGGPNSRWIRTTTICFSVSHRDSINGPYIISASAPRSNNPPLTKTEDALRHSCVILALRQNENFIALSDLYVYLKDYSLDQWNFII